MDPIIVDHHPFFFNVSQLSRIMHCQALPDAAFKGALRKLGYRTTRSHCKPGTVKTDAPWEVIWEVMREWVRQRSPVMEEKFKVNTPGRGVWEKKRTVEDVEMVDEAKDEEKKSEKEGESEEKKSGSADVEPQVNDEKEKRQWAPGDGLDKLHKLEIVFDEKLGKDKEDKKLVRYPMNPRANWGPMNRAK